MLKHCTSAEQGAGRRLHSSLSSVQAELFCGDAQPASQMQLYLGWQGDKVGIKTTREMSKETFENLTKPWSVYPLTFISIRLIEWLLLSSHMIKHLDQTAQKEKRLYFRERETYHLPQRCQGKSNNNHRLLVNIIKVNQLSLLCF